MIGTYTNCKSISGAMIHCGTEIELTFTFGH